MMYKIIEQSGITTDKKLMSDLKQLEVAKVIHIGHSADDHFVIRLPNSYFLDLSDPGNHWSFEVADTIYVIPLKNGEKITIDFVNDGTYLF